MSSKPDTDAMKNLSVGDTASSASAVTEPPTLAAASRIDPEKRTKTSRSDDLAPESGTATPVGVSGLGAPAPSQSVAERGYCRPISPQSEAAIEEPQHGPPIKEESVAGSDNTSFGPPTAEEDFKSEGGTGPLTQAGKWTSEI